jgi:4-amino-4-deoxy-L-arabinose transferase-like glycosyltransferase
MTLSSLRRTWPPLALSLLAFAVRLYNLTYHSLWFDEAMSVHWARSSVSHILEVSINLVEDRLPPLYYVSLHYWRFLVGDGEVAVRLPSVLLGTLLVPVVYRLVTDLLGGSYGRRVAVLAAALTALNPFLIWYSQEARMYAQAVLLGSLGTWFFLQATTKTLGQKGGKTEKKHIPPLCWIGYGLCAVAGLYTHLYTGFLLLAHALYLLLTWRYSRRAWLPFALTMLGVAFLFTPLALSTWRASGEAGPGDPLTGFWARAWWLLSAFSVWKAPLSSGLRSITTFIVAGFALAGLLVPRPYMPTQFSSSRRKPARPILLVGLLLLTPPTIATLLLFRNQVAFFGERYFIVSIPWLLIVVAVGAVNLAARLRAIAAPTRHRSRVTRYLLPATCYLLPIAFTLLPLPGQWSPPARKEAWRDTAGYLETHARPEDAVLIHPDWTRFPLQYYFRGPGQTYAIFGSVKDGTDLDGPLTTISGAHPVVWLVESHTELADPEHRANAWLAERYPAVTELYPPGLAAVRAYAPGYISERLPEQVSPTRAPFEGEVSLVGYAVPQTQVTATDDLFHPPSAWVHVTLYWSAESAPAQNYTPFVHLVDDLGQVWGVSLERPNDAFDFYPPTRWEPEQVIRSDFDVNLNPLTPPGSYMVVVGLRDASGAQVPLDDGSPQVPLASIEVVR